MVVHADECFNSFNGFDQVTVKLYESEVRNHLKKKNLLNLKIITVYTAWSRDFVYKMNLKIEYQWILRGLYHKFSKCIVGSN